MHIFITGGTRGIGNGLVKEFLAKGHQLSYTGTSQKSIDNSIKDIKGDYKTFICDVRNRVDIEKAMSQAIDSFGNIDIWINNAGVDQARHDVSDLSEAEIKRVIDINVLGTMNGTSIALQQMKKQKYGVIYNFEGLGSNNMVIPKTIIYGSSKRLITYFSKACNKELKEYKNIFVGTIQPGMVFTDLLLSNMNDDGMKIAKILGNEVSYVAPRIVKRVLQGKKKIQVMNNLQITWRFMTSIFKK
ncbi:SDR family oxidoreductase [Mycoplasmatota bacterium WC30]